VRGGGARRVLKRVWLWLFNRHRRSAAAAAAADVFWRRRGLAFLSTDEDAEAARAGGDRVARDAERAGLDSATAAAVAAAAAAAAAAGEPGGPEWDAPPPGPALLAWAVRDLSRAAELSPGDKVRARVRSRARGVLRIARTAASGSLGDGGGYMR
jgi:hypothetical protein